MQCNKHQKEAPSGWEGIVKHGKSENWSSVCSAEPPSLAVALLISLLGSRCLKPLKNHWTPSQVPAMVQVALVEGHCLRDHSPYLFIKIYNWEHNYKFQ